MFFKIDPSGEDLRKVLRDYQEEALRFIWTKGEKGANSRETWLHVNETLRGKRKISRASIINFLNAMCDEGVLNYREETCKGGNRRIYTPKLDEAGFRLHIAETVLGSLLRDWPDETITAFTHSIKDKPGLKSRVEAILEEKAPPH